VCEKAARGKEARRLTKKRVNREKNVFFLGRRLNDFRSPCEKKVRQTQRNVGQGGKHKGAQKRGTGITKEMTTETKGGGTKVFVKTAGDASAFVDHSKKGRTTGLGFTPRERGTGEIPRRSG